MKKIYDKIDDLLTEIEKENNPSLTLTKSRILAAKESLNQAKTVQKSGNFSTTPPSFKSSSSPKKNSIPTPVAGADDKKPSHLPESVLSNEDFNTKSPKDIQEQFSEKDIKAFATSNEIKFTDAEDLLLIISRVKKALKPKKDE